MLEKIVADKDKDKQEQEQQQEEEEGGVRKGNPFAKDKDKDKPLQLHSDESDDGGVEAVKHAKCCFCGCREKEPDLPAL